MAVQLLAATLRLAMASPEIRTVEVVVVVVVVLVVCGTRTMRNLGLCRSRDFPQNKPTNFPHVGQTFERHGDRWSFHNFFEGLRSVVGSPRFLRHEVSLPGFWQICWMNFDLGNFEFLMPFFFMIGFIFRPSKSAFLSFALPTFSRQKGEWVQIGYPNRVVMIKNRPVNLMVLKMD